MALRRQGVKAEPGIAFDVSTPSGWPGRAAALPFPLTGAQAGSVEEIARDMAPPEPMNRLVQGDVGSGKTAVAMVAARAGAAGRLPGGADGAHRRSWPSSTTATFAPDARAAGLEVALVTGGGTAKRRSARRARRWRAGEVRIAVGTHALIQEGVEFERLGLVVIDEQHRFGVLQRHALMQQGRAARRAGDDRDADSADAGDDALRRPGRVGDRRAAAGPDAHHDAGLRRDRQRASVYEAMAHELRQGRQAYVRLPAGGGVGEARPGGRDPRRREAARRAVPDRAGGAAPRADEAPRRRTR